MNSTYEMMKKMLLNQIRRDLKRDPSKLQSKNDTKKTESTDKFPTKIVNQTDNIKTARSTFPIKYEQDIISEIPIKKSNNNPISAVKPKLSVSSSNSVHNRQGPVFVRISNPSQTGEKIPINDYSKIQTPIDNTENANEEIKTKSLEAIKNSVEPEPSFVPPFFSDFETEGSIDISTEEKKLDVFPRTNETNSMIYEVDRKVSRILDITSPVGTTLSNSLGQEQNNEINSIVEPTSQYLPQPESDHSNFGISLDKTKIAKIREDTRQVNMILGEIFSDVEDDSFQQSIETKTQTSEIASIKKEAIADLPFRSESLGRLDSRYYSVLQEIIDYDEISLIDFRIIIKKYNLMPLAALEEINTWADDEWGDFLLEEKDNRIRINNGLLFII